MAQVFASIKRKIVGDKHSKSIAAAPAKKPESSIVLSPAKHSVMSHPAPAKHSERLVPAPAEQLERTAPAAEQNPDLNKQLELIAKLQRDAELREQELKKQLGLLAELQREADLKKQQQVELKGQQELNNQSAVIFDDPKNKPQELNNMPAVVSDAPKNKPQELNYTPGPPPGDSPSYSMRTILLYPEASAWYRKNAHRFSDPERLKSATLAQFSS